MRWILLLVLLLSPLCEANDTIKVGISESIPFTIKTTNPDGSVHWTGISVELWEDVADELGLSYTYVELSLVDNLAQVAANDVDVAIGALSITADRDRIMAFTHPYFISGLGVATKTKQSTSWDVYGWKLMKAVAGLLVIIFLSGIVMRYIERKRNPQFEKLGSGMWFSITTMTTTGYGDKTPITPLGRVYAGFLMVTSAIIFPTLVASITTNIVIDQRNNIITDASDLRNHKIGVISGTSAVLYMRQNNIPYVEVPDVHTMLSSIDSGELQGGVYDKPMLQYHAKLFTNVSILPTTFERQYYGFALSSNSIMREGINAEILQKSNNSVWLGTLDKYLGK